MAEDFGQYIHQTCCRLNPQMREPLSLGTFACEGATASDSLSTHEAVTTGKLSDLQLKIGTAIDILRHSVGSGR